ncbi:hypothetical protein [Catenulispora pinisilvae]|uniref:hypothetical protein n=1 Tax=Catenulispora pinisilvae TaxID=2705253 RepID=UPI001891F167|nr:hypothetical protein [Catenulispora pinisilvae]
MVEHRAELQDAGLAKGFQPSQVGRVPGAHPRRQLSQCSDHGVLPVHVRVRVVRGEVVVQQRQRPAAPAPAVVEGQVGQDPPHVRLPGRRSQCR